jgi:hypothetical protein
MSCKFAPISLRTHWFMSAARLAISSLSGFVSDAGRGSRCGVSGCVDRALDVPGFLRARGSSDAAVASPPSRFCVASPSVSCGDGVWALRARLAPLFLIRSTKTAGAARAFLATLAPDTCEPCGLVTARDMWNLRRSIRGGTPRRCWLGREASVLGVVAAAAASCVASALCAFCPLVSGCEM